MNAYTGQIPEAERAPDWRLRANCLGNWDPMHPENDTKEIEAAKAICKGCPVAVDCFFDAVRTGDMTHGIRAGLRPNERRAMVRKLNRRRRKARTQPTDQRIVIAAAQTPQRKSYDTLRNLFEDNTKRLIHGHLAWTGPAKPFFKGRAYNPKQVAFILDRDRNPVGRVLTTCGASGCVLPAHIADDEERMRCGTRGGYQRHLREKSKICAPCRQANTDANNRLLRTGTTKVAA